MYSYHTLAAHNDITTYFQIILVAHTAIVNRRVNRKIKPS